MKANYGRISKKIEATLSPTLRRSLALVATKTAHWGIKDQGDLALIMGVLNFGDPAHTVPNRGKGSEARSVLEDALKANIGVTNLSAIPPRPWLSESSEGKYNRNLKKYVNENIARLVAGLAKRGKAGSASSNRALSINDFLQGLAEVGAENAQDNWENGNFAPNAPMTLRNKGTTKPLHDTGRMSKGSITGWVD